MLSATKHLGPANEILRFAQDDKLRGGLLSSSESLYQDGTKSEIESPFTKGNAYCTPGRGALCTPKCLGVSTYIIV